MAPSNSTRLGVSTQAATGTALSLGHQEEQISSTCAGADESAPAGSSSRTVVQSALLGLAPQVPLPLFKLEGRNGRHGRSYPVWRQPSPGGTGQSCSSLRVLLTDW